MFSRYVVKQGENTFVRNLLYYLKILGKLGYILVPDFVILTARKLTVVSHNSETTLIL